MVRSVKRVSNKKVRNPKKGYKNYEKMYRRRYKGKKNRKQAVLEAGQKWITLSKATQAKYERMIIQRKKSNAKSQCKKSKRSSHCKINKPNKNIISRSQNIRLKRRSATRLRYVRRTKSVRKLSRKNVTRRENKSHKKPVKRSVHPCVDTSKYVEPIDQETVINNFLHRLRRSTVNIRQRQSRAKVCKSSDKISMQQDAALYDSKNSKEKRSLNQMDTNESCDETPSAAKKDSEEMCRRYDCESTFSY